MSDLATISGELLELRTFGNWGLGRMLSGNAVHTVVGEALVGLEVDRSRADRNQYRFTGSWKNHPKFGKQFDVAGITADVEPTRDALIKFLVRHFEGCGVRTADKIVDWYLENGGLADLRDLLIHQPENLPFQPFFGGKRGQIVYVDDSGATMELQVYRRIAVQLGGRGIPDPLLRRLGAYLYGVVAGATGVKSGVVEAAWQELRRDCYFPILRVEGYGFGTAEIIGNFFGIAKDAPERLAAIAHHVLEEASKNKGHVYLTRAEYSAGVRAVDPDADFGDALAHAIARGLPVAHEDDRYYLGMLLKAERYIAERFARMGRPRFAPIYTGGDAFLDHAINTAEQEKGEQFKLDASQRAAVKALLTSKCLLHTLTAGPGSGKTAIMEILVQCVQMVSVCFLAPTGKAAKVLNSRVQPYRREAMTIHRALEPSASGFQRTSENPLCFRVVVVDEASMVDLPLMADLLDATPEDSHLILIGDMDQLPSVGPGRVLEDAVLLPGDHTRLTQTHRNKGGILDLVRRVREGFIADDRAEDVSFMGDMGDASTGFDQYVLPAYLSAVQRCGVANVNLIMPRRKGKRDEPNWNVTYANARVQDCLNPEVVATGFAARQTYVDQVGRKVPEAGYFRIGDRVMVRKNLLIPNRDPSDQREIGVDGGGGEDEAQSYEAVVNGDTGFIAAAHCRATGALLAVSLDLDDGRKIRFPVAFMDYLALAYAGTVHSAQGSEYREVVVVLNNGHPDFLHRRIVYTAVSRARDKLTVFGAFWIMQKLVARPGPERNSGLVARVNARLTPEEVAAAALLRAAQPKPTAAVQPDAPRMEAPPPPLTGDGPGDFDLDDVPM